MFDKNLIRIQDGSLKLHDILRELYILWLVISRFLQQVNHVKEAFDTIMSVAKTRGFFYEDISSDNNEAARLASQKFYLDTYCHEGENLYGSNHTNNAIISENDNKKYVFPKNCTFYCYDVRDMEKKMEMNNQYDFILLDPPWWNKSIRRKKIKCAEAR